jgi:hypothetical protein
VRSPSDFDGLDVPGSWHLNHRLVPQVRDSIANNKKNQERKSNANESEIFKNSMEGPFTFVKNKGGLLSFKKILMQL